MSSTVHGIRNFSVRGEILPRNIHFLWKKYKVVECSGQHRHVRIAEARSAGLLLALSTPPCPKKEKRYNKDSASIRKSVRSDSFTGLINHGFTRSDQRGEEKNLRDIMNSAEQGPNSIVACRLANPVQQSQVQRFVVDVSMAHEWKPNPQLFCSPGYRYSSERGSATAPPPFHRAASTRKLDKHPRSSKLPGPPNSFTADRSPPASTTQQRVEQRSSKLCTPGHRRSPRASTKVTLP